MAKKNIEAEGGELVLQNDNGDTIIIPKNKRNEALKMLNENDYAGIDNIAKSLPYMEDYAEDGTLIPTDLGGGNLSKKERKEQTAINTQKQKDISLTSDIASMQRLVDKTSNVGLNTPEISKKSVTMEDIHPSIKEFGDAIYKAPEFTNLNYSKAKKTLDSWGIPKYKEDLKNLEMSLFDQGKSEEEVSKEVKNFNSNWPSDKPNPYIHGCTGSACRLPMEGAENYYKLRQQAGITSVQTGDDEEFGSGYEQGDAWEFAQMMEKSGLGKILFKPDEKYEGLDKYGYDTRRKKDRAEWAKNFGDVPIGTVFNTGFSEGVYTEPEEKSIMTQKGKQIELDPNVRSRHSIKLWGIDPDTQDYMIYDYGKLDRVKNDPKAIEEYLNEKKVMKASVMNTYGDWSQNKLNRLRKHNRRYEDITK